MLEQIVLQDWSQPVHQQEPNYVQNKNIFVVLERPVGKIVIELDWLSIVIEEQALVDPVCDEEKQCRNWIKERHAS